MIDGPMLPPRSGTAKQMVVLLHGYGSNGDDLISIGAEWASALPDAVFLSPHAPDRCEAWAQGYQWFSIRTVEGIVTKEFERAELIQPPAAALNAYLDAQLGKWGIAEDKLLVAGFSQGAMMAMYTMPRRAKACAGVIGYSGLLVDAKSLTAPGIAKMPVLAVHGAADDVVPPFCLEGVSEGFTAAGFDVETILRPGLGHGIDQVGFMRGLAFTKACFGLEP